MKIMVLPRRCFPASPSRLVERYGPTVERIVGGIRRTFAANANYPDVSSHPFRSMLYVPTSNARALEKLDTLAGTMKPDAVMFDLEDAVSPDRKDEARKNLAEYFRKRKAVPSTSPPHDYYGMVRINRCGTPWFEADASMALGMVMEKETNISGVVLPKVEGRNDVDAISQHFLGLCNDEGPLLTESNVGDRVSSVSSPVPLWAMVETPRAILAASEIAQAESIQGLILGTNDLSKELRLHPTESAAAAGGAASSTGTREGLLTSIQIAILAARAHDKIVIDGVYNNFRDEAGFRIECLQGKEWGVDGKTLIHPNQIPATNEILAPSAKEIEYARRVVACWEETGSSFTGVAVLDGMMIEQLHVDIAKRLLRQAERIDRMK